MYYGGEGARQNYAEAFKWFKLSANQGNNSAQYNLGIMYANGKGVRQDHAEAKEWFGKSCDNGLQTGCDQYKKMNELGI